MENSNLTSVGNGTSAANSNRARNRLSEIQQALVKSTQELFPTWINTNIFNTIYTFGILANLLLLVYLIYYERYKMPVFCVILSLAIADLGVCVGCLTYYTLVTPTITGPLWLCKVALALKHPTYLSSSYHIALFAVLRFIQLVYPLMSHSKVTTALMLKICLAIWGIHAIHPIFSAIFYRAVCISTIEGNDVYMCLFTGNIQILVIWVIIVWCCLPFLTTCGFHIAKQGIVMLSLSASVTTHQERIQHLRRQTDSGALAIVIVAYLITIAPYIVQALRIYALKVTHTPIQVYLVDVFDQLSYSNSAINPWIYMFAAESVRSDIKNMLACNTARNN